jgi:hypothetical protein
MDVYTFGNAIGGTDVKALEFSPHEVGLLLAALETRIELIDGAQHEL